MRTTALLLALVTVGAAQSVVITHVNVVDVRAGRIVADQNVMLADGKIASISKKSRKKTETVVDGRGKYLIPGLWDMHTHIAGISSEPEWAEQMLAIYLRHGITGVRDMAGDVTTLRKIRERQGGGSAKLPRMFFSGPFIDGSAQGFPHAADVIAVTTAEEARQAVQKVLAEGVDFVKVGSSLSREPFFAIADECKRANKTFVGHVPESVSVQEAADAGMKSMEHLFGFDFAVSRRGNQQREEYLQAGAKHDTRTRIATLQAARENYDPRLAADLARKLKRDGTWIVPTLSWTQLTATLDTIDATKDVAHMPAKLQEDWAPAKLKAMNSPGVRAYYQRKLEDDIKLVKAMHAGGVRILAGSDSLDPGVFPGSSLQLELELLVQAGLTPTEALQSATSEAAAFLSVTDQYGSLSAGKRADLVLLDANPLVDIRATRKVSAVFLDGQLVKNQSSANPQ